MKKILTLLIVGVVTASILCGCSKSAPKSRRAAPVEPVQPRVEQPRDNESNGVTHDVRITIDGETLDGFTGNIDIRTPLSGVRRRFMPDRSGTYTVEYVHAPYGIERDETLDYKLTLNNDNTFTLNVVSKGVATEHHGRWYTRSSEIMMFYDEPIDQPAHNVYVADSMYGELLPQGKILIYDNCHTVILSRPQATLYEK